MERGDIDCVKLKSLQSGCFSFSNYDRKPVQLVMKSRDERKLNRSVACVGIAGIQDVELLQLRRSELV